MEFEGRVKKKISGKLPDFGAIFMSNASTKHECFKRKLFGLPMSSADFVKGVKVGMILFLFEYEKRELYGVFKATSDGELNIMPHAYSSSGKKFPAQVRFTTIWHCHPLQEHEFRNAIRKNYFATEKFNFGLSKNQVQRLLWLFDSRKIRLFQSQSFIGSEIRKRYHEPSPKKREKNWPNHTKSAKKKLKRDIDSISHSNEEPLAYSGKSTVAKVESQLLDSGDSHIACKESDSMHCNCSYCPEGPCSQSSLAFVASHSSSSGQELGPHPEHGIQKQPVSVGEELKELETSGKFDSDLGDYIPLWLSDDSDSTDTMASPESGCFLQDHIASGLYEDTCQLVSAASVITKVGNVDIKENAYSLKSPVEKCQENNHSDFIHHQNTSIMGLYSDASNNRSSVFSRLNFSSMIDKENAYSLKSPVEKCQENNHSDFIHQYTSIMGLYSDASNNRSSVFSHLNFSSRVQDKEDATRMEKSVHITRKQKCSTEVNKSAQEIMEELQKMHAKWKKTVRMARSNERQNEHTVSKNRSAFSRLSWTSEPDVQDDDISTRSQERHDKQRNMRENKCPVSGGNRTSVFLRLGRTSETDVPDSGNPTLLQESWQAEEDTRN